MKIDDILKNLNEQVGAANLDIKTKAQLNSCFQQLMSVATDENTTFELKQKKLTLLAEEFTQKIDVNGANGNK